ncbi:MAG TPA: sigma-70 family RNA polymerase sigma factor [Candidatus Angelobacter sp.]|nr:sigma-70 family RNA polymerase sigma factor [Candidatus Angelobacter sp.]
MGTAPCVDLHQFNESYLQGLRAQDGVTEAHFVSYFGRLLQNKLRRHLACPEHIKDVQQETLLRAWAAVRAEGGVRQPERFGAFVSSVCNNILRELYRSRARTRALDEAQNDPIDDSMGPDAILLAEESKKLVQKVLTQLCSKDRKLLQAVFFDQRNKDEVCQELGVSRDYLRVLLHRARLQFMAEYERLNALPRKSNIQIRKAIRPMAS